MSLRSARALSVWVLTLYFTLLWLCTSVQAVTVTWNNAVGGSWANASNWSPALVPDNTTDCIVSSVGTFSIVAPTTGSQACASLSLNGSGITLNTAAAGMTISNLLSFSAGTIAVRECCIILSHVLKGAHRVSLGAPSRREGFIGQAVSSPVQVFAHHVKKRTARTMYHTFVTQVNYSFSGPQQ